MEGTIQLAAAKPDARIGRPKSQKPMSSIEHEPQPVNAQSKERFRFGSAFASADLEQQYRLSQLDSNRQVASWCIIATIFGVALFATSDFRLFGTSTQFMILLGRAAAVHHRFARRPPFRALNAIAGFV